MGRWKDHDVWRLLLLPFQHNSGGGEKMETPPPAGVGKIGGEPLQTTTDAAATLHTVLHTRSCWAALAEWLRIKK